MTVNLTPFERAARCWVGMVILATPLLELSAYPYQLLGLIPLVTGLMGYSPVYALIHRLRTLKSHGFQQPSETGASRA